MDLTEFNEWLEARHLSGYWMSRQQEPALRPYLWKWAELHRGLMTAGELVSMQTVNMRTVSPSNPTLGVGISKTLSCSLQSLLPGERTKLHRALQGETRFVLQGCPGATFVVEGEPFPIEEGDLIVTPHRAWHDHYNDGSETVYWLDALDSPLVTTLAGAGAWAYFNERPAKTYQDLTKPEGATAASLGALQPPWLARNAVETPLRFRWNDTYRTLRELRDRKGDACDGVLLRYTHPLHGGPVLPTYSCEIQLLRGGEVTGSHRHTATTIYHAFRGGGVTVVNEEELAWEQGDIFVVPSWCWHHHENRSGEDALLYSLSDWPTLTALQLFREEVEAKT